MFTCSYKIKVFAFYLVHHGIHFSKAHNTGHYITADHKWRNTVSKSAVDHKVSCVCDDCRVKSGNISHEIIEAVSCNFSCTLKIYALEVLHDLRMIRNFKVWHHRLAVLLYFYIFTVVFTDRNRRIDDIWNTHHDLLDLFFYLLFFS